MRRKIYIFSFNSQWIKENHRSWEIISAKFSILILLFWSSSNEPHGKNVECFIHDTAEFFICFTLWQVALLKKRRHAVSSTRAFLSNFNNPTAKFAERSISFFQAFRRNFPFVPIILADERARARKIRGDTLSFSRAVTALIHFYFYARPLPGRR